MNCLMKKCWFLMIMLVCVQWAGTTYGKSKLFDWTPGAPGGGGAHTFAESSPHDDQLLFSANDMWGFYRSTDGGHNWHIVHVPGGAATFHGLAYDPVKPDRVFLGVSTGFFMSDDRGKTWRKVGLADQIKDREGPNLIAFDPNDSQQASAVVRDDDLNYRIVTKDGGLTWTDAGLLPFGKTKVHKLLYEISNPRIMIAGCTNGVYVSEDAGAHWEKRMNGIPADRASLVSFAGGYSDGRTLLYCTVGTRTIDGKLDTGIFRSSNVGKNWNPVKTQGLHTTPVTSGNGFEYALLAVPLNVGNVCYVSTWNPGCDPKKEGECTTVYKTTDGGYSWEPVLFQHPDMQKYNLANKSWLTGLWGWSEPQLTMSVSTTNPDLIMYCNWVNLIISNNGGKDWFYSDGTLNENGTIQNDPMMVLTVNLYHISPHDPKYHHMSTADFCGWYSRDGGHSWYRSEKGIPQPHNIYDIAFDPDVPNRIWAASSRKHDIPQWNFIGRDPVLTTQYYGSIAYSENGGETWRQINEEGLPPLTTLSLYLDPQSPVESRHIWAAVLGKGFYLSQDGGKTWESRTGEINDEGHIKALRIKRGPDGKMYGLTSVGGANFKTGYIYSGGLYVSDNEGKSWKLISDKSQMQYPCDFTFNPHDPNEIFISCMTPPIEGYTGGVWRTRDGGETWEQIFADSCFSTTIDPLDPNRLYICTSGEALTKGVYTSSDRGKTWQVLDCPSKRPRHVLFDPNDPNLIYVSSWGSGLWRGNRIKK